MEQQDLYTKALLYYNQKDNTMKIGIVYRKLLNSKWIYTLTVIESFASTLLCIWLYGKIAHETFHFSQLSEDWLSIALFVILFISTFFIDNRFHKKMRDIMNENVTE